MIRSISITRSLRRLGAAMLAVVQLGAASVVVVADAVLDGSQTGRTAHVESQGSDACTAHHDHLFCQVVRSLSKAARSHPGAGPAAATPGVLADARLQPTPPVRTPLRSGTVGSRAPPLV